MSALTQRCKALFGYMDQLVHPNTFGPPGYPNHCSSAVRRLLDQRHSDLPHRRGKQSALVFVLAVVCISFFTTGYAYGITASIIGTFCINYFFMVPYSAFSLSHTGYPVAMLSMVAISCIVCALIFPGQAAGH